LLTLANEFSPFVLSSLPVEVYGTYVQRVKTGCNLWEARRTGRKLMGNPVRQK